MSSSAVVSTDLYQKEEEEDASYHVEVLRTAVNKMSEASSSNDSAVQDADLSSIQDVSESNSRSDGSSSSGILFQEEALKPVYQPSRRQRKLSLVQAVDSPVSLPPSCTACKTSDSSAVANCFTCSSYLCANCVIAHQIMIAFEGHSVTNLGLPPPPTESKEDSAARLSLLLKESRKKLGDVMKTSKTVDFASYRLSSQYEKAKNDVAETYNFYVSMLGERKMETIKDIEKAFSSRQVQLSLFGQKCQEIIDSLEQTLSFMEKLNVASPRDILLFQSSLESRLTNYFASLPQFDISDSCQLEFISNFQAIQVGVRNQFGYIKTGSEVGLVQTNGHTKQPPISRPVATASNHFPRQSVSGSSLKLPSPDSQNNLQNNSSSLCMFGNLSLVNGVNMSPDFSTLASLPSPVLSYVPTPSPPIVYPPKAQIKRQKMIYHCKFGEFGILEGQFTEPSGVAVTDDNNIVVADTNNHRIQIFDQDGIFKFQFGEVGKRDGQLLYPNRVAVVAGSGDIVVTERSPTHQVQIFTKFGQFIRKFGADVLQHPRGVAVDSWGRIVVVECKVMRVVLFDMVGNVLGKFSCSHHLEFPNGVAVNDQMEIFISDNRAHCVKVFDYQGNYLRQIGGEGVSNFPIGVGLTADGNIAIADNHNNFNLTVFSPAGQLLWALESKVKHAQCFDVALMRDGSIVLASKDYRLYIYRYVKVPAIV